MIILEISLSRAHKIAERLSTLMKDTLEEAKDQASSVSFSSPPSSSNLLALNYRGANVMALNGLAYEYASALAEVRIIISLENHKRGIDSMLAKMEILNKFIAHYKVLLSNSKLDGYLPSEIAEYKPNDSYGFSLTVNALREAEVSEDIKSQLSILQREVIQLSDAIAESNSGKVKIELAPKIAEAVSS